MAFTSGVSPRLITKIEADPDDYVLKSDTMEKIASGLGVPAFMLFFPSDVKLLNTMLSKSLIRILMSNESQILTPEAMINMFLPHQQADGASDRQPQSHAAGRR